MPNYGASPQRTPLLRPDQNTSNQYSTFDEKWSEKKNYEPDRSSDKYYNNAPSGYNFRYGKRSPIESSANCLRVLWGSLSAIFLGLGIMSLCGVGPWAAVTKGVTRKVAIIGAGASGVSAAYHLAKYGPGGSSADSLEITVFEKSPIVGGRCLVLDVPTAGEIYPSTLKVDIGAPGYNSDVDKLVSSIVREVGLQDQVVPGGRWAPVTADWDLGIYNGHSLLFRQPHNAGGIWYWWTNLGYFFRYGWAHQNLEAISKRLMPQWFSYSQALSFPASWTSSSPNQALKTSDLKTAITTAGTSFLNSKKVKHPFTTEQIQSRVRARYGSNLGVVSGMQALVIMEEMKDEMSTNVILKNGMGELFDKMLHTTRHSRNVRIDLKLGTIVGGMRKNETEGQTFGWTVAHWSVVGDDEPEPDLIMEDFDEVVIAGPWHLTDLNMQPEYPIQKFSWEKAHVTVFTSTNKLAPGSFGLGGDDHKGMPQRILSTLDDSERDNLNEKSGKEGVGNTGWWSVEHIGVVPRIIPGIESCEDLELCPESIRMENVFKILSPGEILNDTIIHMLGGDADSLTWVYRHFWEHAYATPLPEEMTDQDIFRSLAVDDGLWYTAGIESVWGGVEAAMTMGERAASEILDKWSPTVPKRGTVRRGEGR